MQIQEIHTLVFVSSCLKVRKENGINTFLDLSNGT